MTIVKRNILTQRVPIDDPIDLFLVSIDSQRFGVHFNNACSISEAFTEYVIANMTTVDCNSTLYLNYEGTVVAIIAEYICYQSVKITPDFERTALPFQIYAAADDLNFTEVSSAVINYLSQYVSDINVLMAVIDMSRGKDVDFDQFTPKHEVFEAIVKLKFNIECFAMQIESSDRIKEVRDFLEDIVDRVHEALKGVDVEIPETMSLAEEYELSRRKNENNLNFDLSQIISAKNFTNSTH